MLILRRYENPVDAENAGEHLRAVGIESRICLTVGVEPVGYLIVILDRTRRAEAEQVVGDLPEVPLKLDQPLEVSARPDLSVLDPSLAPACPRCSDTLPLDAAATFCPACGATVDVAELIATARGPEVLALCYPEPPHGIPLELLDAARLACRSCGYALDGLATRGTCPECGSPYSKADLIRGLG